MRDSCAVALLLSTLGSFQADAAIPTYYSPIATEAWIEFDASVVLDSAGGAEPTEAAARAQINEQTQFIVGTLRNRGDSAPRAQAAISDIRLERAERDSYRVHYHYRNRIFIRNSQDTHLTLFLPVNPDTTFAKSELRCGGSSSYDFWYYWNPKSGACPLVPETDYQTLSVPLTRVPNTQITYPEYARLASPKRVIDVHLLFGWAGAPGSVNDPLRSSDTNAQTYRLHRNQLMSQHTGRRWTDEEIRQLTGPLSGPLPYVEEFERKIGDVTVRARLFFGDTDFHRDSKAFHYFWKDALERASVVIYSGHAGLGKNLNPDLIEAREGFRIELPRDRYQILIANACATYSYYTGNFFARKVTNTDPAGTKNLDILSNGIDGDWTYYMLAGNWGLYAAIEKWLERGEATSYQQMVSSVDSRYFFAVNGDEDNDAR